MSKSFDITLKHLLEAYPRDWLRLIGISPDCEVEIVDADLATVTAEADKLLYLKGSRPWLLNLELQASYKADLPDRLHFGGTLAKRRLGLPVQSVAILLRPQADGPAMTGQLVLEHPPERAYLEFRYDVLRLWQMPVDTVLSGGLGIVPLAPLAQGAETQLERIVARMEEQLSVVSNRAEQGSLWAAAFVLMGLRYSREQAQALFRGVHTMEESVTYQAIVQKGFSLGVLKGREEGREEGRETGRETGHIEAARDLLLDLGAKRFGAPPESIVKQVNSLADYERLKRLTERLLEIENWGQLEIE